MPADRGRCMTPRFTIRWDSDNAAYRVSRPNYDGGEVVDAAEYDRLRGALDQAIYHADNLQRYIECKPVRDLAESRAGLEAAREAQAP